MPQAPSAIRAITFDFDDTLWPIAPVIAYAEAQLQRWLEKHCPAVAGAWPIERLRQAREVAQKVRPEYAHDRSALRRTVLAEAMIPFGYEALIEPAFQVFFVARHKVTLFDDVLPALQRLSQCYRIAGISNGNAVLAKVGLQPMFDFTVRASAVGSAKPAPAIFRAALRRFDLPPSAVVHVGDHLEEDVGGAMGVGMHAIWLNRFDRPSAPSVTSVRNLADLPEAIENLGS